MREKKRRGKKGGGTKITYEKLYLIITKKDVVHFSSIFRKNLLYKCFSMVSFISTAGHKTH